MSRKICTGLLALVFLIVILPGCEEKIVPVSTEGYTTTPSGLKYRVEQEGTGKSPIAWDLVEVNYEGKLMDGQVFDSSYERKKSLTFYLSKVIDGWTEGVQLMKEGAIYHFIIPPELAYGERGQGSVIPPNSTLYFKIELIDVK